ncbi:hepatocyte growth factor receptor-like isoform X2 [Mercenaria mercenaria]|nr:hepatocyte growth factor receptor-like isoform X2 [Mercenaria mercenaria]
MTAVKEYFEDEQRDCFDGNKGSFPSWIQPPGESCVKKVNLLNIKCGYTDKNTRIVFDGLLKKSDKSVFSKPSEKITSVVVTPYENIFVGYLGTDSGILEKILFNSSFGNSVTVFRSKGNGQIRSLTLSNDGSSLFYIEDTKKKSLRTWDCAVHTTCYGCLSDIVSCIWQQEPYDGVQPPNGRCISNETRVEKTADVFHYFCPPLVYNVHPNKGPTVGGTVLNLTGLMDNPARYGKNSQNYRVPAIVTIENATCNVSDATEFPVRLECITPVAQTAGAFRISLEMHNNVTNTSIRGRFQTIVSKGRADYQPEFVYVDPVLFDRGVVYESVKLSGKIQLTIRGENLDIGSTRRVLIGEHDCLITEFDRIEDNKITCRSPKLNDARNYTIVYEIDNTRVFGPVVTYTPEPVVHDIQPRSSIVSGGLTLTLSGENLEGFGQTCQLSLDDNNITEMNVSFCEITYEATDAVLLCKTTAFDSLNSLPFWTVPTLFNVYGKLRTIDRLPVLIVEDPVMDRDDQIIPISVNTNETEIYFKGSMLANISKHDVKISVGITRCVVNEVHEDGILCEVFDLVSATDGLKGRVKCEIGYRSYDVGTVAFQIEQQPPVNVASRPQSNYNSAVVTGAVMFGLLVVAVVGIGIKKIKNKRHRSLDEPYNVHYRRDSNVPTQGGLSESHTSEVIQNRQNEHRNLRGEAQDNTFVKESEPLLPVIDEDTQAMFAQKNLIILNECLILGEIVGQGHFGCVYKGYLTLPNENAEKIVACKTLHRNNPKDLDVNMFLKEALLMKDFHHKNVMELIGICLGVDKLPLVVLPFMRKGDVLSYIRDVNNQPTVKELVVFGVDIANGMHYLSQLKFIHRDLAARNCMIDDNMRVKVADFGLTRDVYEKEYYSSCDKKAQLPVKWMSPESLEFGLFTHKSDVWSFGVVLWELLTRGVNPYPTVDNWDILRYLKEGRKLNKPDFCPNEMYRIMQQCWNWDPEERPLFGDLTIKIPELLRKLERASEKRKQLETS